MNLHPDLHLTFVKKTGRPGGPGAYDNLRYSIKQVSDFADNRLKPG
jgi:hypothetical protein